MTRLVISLILVTWPVLFLSSLAASQRVDQPPVFPDAPSAQNGPKQNSYHQGTQIIILLTRRSYCFPDLATSITPLPVSQKFTLFLNNSISGHIVLGSAASAGLGQALNWQAGYGQGAEGYGKRFGASMARSASSNFFGTFLFASILRQDPRFFVRNSPTFTQALKYSLTRLVITRRDSGEETVNSSGLLGPLAGEGLANAYLPIEDRTVSNTFQRYAADLGWRAAGNVLREYWPTLSKRLIRSKRSGP
jgi:hypothetical protein